MVLGTRFSESSAFKDKHNGHRRERGVKKGEEKAFLKRRKGVKSAQGSSSSESADSSDSTTRQYCQ